MDLQINNLIAQMQGRNLHIIQKADALIEFNKLCDYVNDLEKQVKKLNIDDVSNQRELLLEEMDKYLMLNTNLDVKDLLDFKERFKQ